MTVRDVTPLPKVPFKRRKRKGIPASVRKQVRERSRGECETRGFSNDCGTLANHMHHVRPRSRGGKDTPENLLHVCGGPFGGDGGCHGAIHAQPERAKRLGYLR